MMHEACAVGDGVYFVVQPRPSVQASTARMKTLESAPAACWVVAYAGALPLSGPEQPRILRFVLRTQDGQHRCVGLAFGVAALQGLLDS